MFPKATRSAAHHYYHLFMANELNRVDNRRRGLNAVGLVLSATVGLFALSACLSGILSAVGSANESARPGGAFADDIALVAISAVVATVCAVLAVHFEHRIRHARPVARSRSGSGPVWATPHVWSYRIGRGSTSPGVMSFQLLIFTGLSIAFIVGAVRSHSAADRSALVQHHGIAREATLLTVKNSYHSSRSGGYYTADLDMSFEPALGGQTITVVHYPGQVHALPGSRFQILVDPADPGYAELPGAPATKSYMWIVLLAFAALLGLVDAIFVRAFIRLRRDRRAP